MPALTRTTVSPNEKADLILRHFPALLPVYDESRGEWAAPSMTEKGVSYAVRAFKHGDQPTYRNCQCKATRTCTHETLIERLTDGALMPGERVNGRLNQPTRSAGYNEAKFAHLMRANYAAEGL